MTLVRPFTTPLPEALGRRMPLLKFLLPMAAGIVLGWTCKDMMNTWTWLLTATFCTLIAIGALQRKSNLAKWASAASMAVALVCLAAAWSMHHYNRIVVKWPQNPQLWLAQVEQIKKVKDTHIALIANIKSDDKRYNQKRIQINLQGANAQQLQCGTDFAFKARIRNDNRPGNPGDFDYATYLLQHGLSGNAYCTSTAYKVLPTISTHNWRSQLLNLRQKLVEQYTQYFHNTDLSLLAALTLGDKSLLTTETQQLFSDTGTSHVLALSGLHIGILISLFNLLLLKRLRQRSKRFAANILLLAALWGFVFLAGAPLSLLRAALMYTLMQVALAMQRMHTLSLNNLAFAALLLLIIDPFTLFDVGFQLSFTAVFFILITNDYVWKHHPIPYWLEDLTYFHTPRKDIYTPQYYFVHITLHKWIHRFKGYTYEFCRTVLLPFICISLSAQWGTAPLVLHYFHTLAPYAWLSNFVVIPAAYVLLSGALLFLLLPFAFAQSALAKLMGITLHTLTQCLQAISDWPLATCRIYATPFTLACIWLVPILLFFFYEKHNALVRKRLLMSAFALTIMSIVVETYSTLVVKRITPSIYVYRVPHTSLVHFVQSEHTSYLLSSTTADSTQLRMASIKQNFFEPHHMATPTLITQSRANYPTLQRANHLFVFHHQRIVVLNAPITSAPPTLIDLLIVANGSYTNATSWLITTRVKQVVLDSSLSIRQRKIWTSACRSAHIPCYDVLQQGAFAMSMP